MPDLCILYGCNIKVTLKIADLYKERPFLTIIARNECKEGKKWIDFAISSCLGLFRGRANETLR